MDKQDGPLDLFLTKSFQYAQAFRTARRFSMGKGALRPLMATPNSWRLALRVPKLRAGAPT
jgi:hypothetical protein